MSLRRLNSESSILVPCEDGVMTGFLLRIVINAAAIWLTTLIVTGVSVEPFAEGVGPELLTYGLVALIFALVNSVIGTGSRVVAFSPDILTPGLAIGRL